jgi:hypothetical protein
VSSVVQAGDVRKGDVIVEQGDVVTVEDRRMHAGQVVLVLCGLDYHYDPAEPVHVLR